MFVYLLILLLATIFPAKWIYQYFCNPINSLPGPRIHTIRPIDFTKNPSDLILEWFKDYGHTYCWKLVAYKSVLVTIDPAIVKQVFTGKTRYINKMDVGLQYITGHHGLLANEDKEHNDQRSLFRSKFTKKSIKELIPEFQVVVDRLIQRWNDKLNESDDGSITVDIKYEFTNLTLEVLCELLLDYPINSINDESDVTKDLYKTLTEYLNVFNKYNLLGYQYIGKYVRYLPTITNIQYWRARIVLTNLISSIMYNNISNGGNNKLIDIINGNHGLSQIEIFDSILTIFLAGHETTASTLSWILFELCRDPEHQERMRSNNTYQDHVVKETLRLHPPVPIIGRRTTNDLKINEELTIPKDTDIIISTIAAHTCEDYWNNPLEFNPNRWEDIKINPYIYMPFLSGPRGCLGKRFALEEIHIALRSILAEFEFSSNTVDCVTNKIDFTSKPDGLIVNITKL